MMARSCVPAWKSLGRKRREIVDRERIDDGDLVVGRELQKAEFRVVGLLAKELGIHGEHGAFRRAAREILEIGLVGNIHT